MSYTEENRALQAWYRQALKESSRELNAEYRRRESELRARYSDYLKDHYGEL